MKYLKELIALEVHVRSGKPASTFELDHSKPTLSLLEQQGLDAESTAEQYCEAIYRHVSLSRDHPHWIDEQRMKTIMSSKRLIPGWVQGINPAFKRCVITNFG